jgi:hypothetical protein
MSAEWQYTNRPLFLLWLQTGCALSKSPPVDLNSVLLLTWINRTGNPEIDIVAGDGFLRREHNGR